MKSILLIGGMGHVASMSVHDTLLKRIRELRLEMPVIQHTQVVVEPFFASTPKLVINDTSRRLLWRS